MKWSYILALSHRVQIDYTTHKAANAHAIKPSHTVNITIDTKTAICTTKLLVWLRYWQPHNSITFTGTFTYFVNFIASKNIGAIFSAEKYKDRSY